MYWGNILETRAKYGWNTGKMYRSTAYIYIMPLMWWMVPKASKDCTEIGPDSAQGGHEWPF